MALSPRSLIYKILLLFLSLSFFILIGEIFSRSFLEPRIDTNLRILANQLGEGSAAEELFDKIGDVTNLNRLSPKYPHPFFGFSRPLTPENQSFEKLVYGFVERPELWELQKDPETLFVGIFGGSVAAQAHYFEQQNHVFKNFLERNIKGSQWKKIRVLNFAYSGYRQPQQFVIASFFLDKLDVSINIEGVNEAKLSKSQLYPPYYPTPAVSNLFFLQESYETKKKQLSLFMDYLEISTKQRQLRERSWHSSFLRVIIKTQIFNCWKRILNVFNELQINREGPWKTSDLQKLIKTNVQLWIKFIKQQETMAKSFNVISIYALQPTPYLVEKPLSLGESNLLEQLNPGEYLERKTIYRRFQTEADRLRKIGFPIIDLSALFTNTPETVFVDACCHLNTRGNTLLLEHLAKITAEKLNGIKK